MQDTKRIWVWVGVAVVVIAIVVVVVWGPSKQQGQAPVTYAPQGQVVAQFPTQLILDPQAEVNKSYSINYSSGDQYTAAWNSSTSIAAFFERYKLYLPQNGWMITNQITNGTTSLGIYASNSSSDVSVSMIKKGTGSAVTVTYLLK